MDFSASERDFLNSMDNNLTSQKHIKFDVILANGTEYPMQGEPVAIDRNVDAQTGTINIVGHISQSEPDAAARHVRSASAPR